MTYIGKFNIIISDGGCDSYYNKTKKLNIKKKTNKKKIKYKRN